MTQPSHRWKVLLFFVVLAIIALGVFAGGVVGYEYTESTEFCGTVCHSMDPQYVRFQQSSHANVACAHCHVGPGAQSFVQSKIDGTRQLISTIFDNYSRPIKSPVHNLRPARETCEGCHTPTRFKDNIVKVIMHYDDDAQNTAISNTLILKMGGWKENSGISKGIHWHVSSEVYYIALDDQRQVMGWVGVKQDDGSMKEYFARDLAGMSQTAFVEKARAAGEIRRMDCIDCHNRAAHYIPYPEQAVDQAISNDLISRDLPFVRKNAVDLLTTEYASEEEALAAIDGLAAYYKANPAEGVTDEKVSQAIATLKDIYHQTNFPDMNLDWRTNPNNARHTPTLGCFRCHDGKHVSSSVDASGNAEVISVKCNLCHTVPITGRGDATLVEAPVIVGDVPASHSDFRWTVDHRSVTEAEKQECYQCHGQSFCNNGACHNLSHPANMLFTHAEEYKRQGGQVCYTCHQNISCTRCHPSGIINLP